MSNAKEIQADYQAYRKELDKYTELCAQTPANSTAYQVYKHKKEEAWKNCDRLEVVLQAIAVAEDWSKIMLKQESPTRSLMLGWGLF